MATQTSDGRQSRPRFDLLVHAARIEWLALGSIGRWSVLGLMFSAVVAITLGLAIPRRVERHLLDGEAASLGRVVADIGATGVLPLALDDREAVGDLEESIRVHLLGTDAVRVKIWAEDGSIIFSDEDALVGQTFGFPDAVKRAFQGETVVETPDLNREETEFERGLGELVEFHLPVRGASGDVVSVFEVYEIADKLTGTVGAVRQTVWTAIGLGIGLLALFTAVLTFVNGAIVDRRRRQAEALLGEVLRAQDDERQRIVGALHDDIGQPLYRVMFGLEAIASGAPPSTVAEVSRLQTMLRSIDKKLRAELRMLHEAGVEERDLASALAELAGTTRRETGIDVTVHAGDITPLTPAVRGVLYQAVREAIVNARKHARADRIDVVLIERRGRIEVVVEDNGIGYKGTESLGITTMRERLAAVGGGLNVAGIVTGTRFTAWVPVSSVTA